MNEGVLRVDLFRRNAQRLSTAAKFYKFLLSSLFPVDVKRFRIGEDNVDTSHPSFFSNEKEARSQSLKEVNDKFNSLPSTH